MTCIVGVIKQEAAQKRIYMGCDSAGVSGMDIKTRLDPKVFTNGPFLIGFSGSFRMGQILRYKFKPPTIGANEDLYKFMVTSFIDSVRECFKENGYSKLTNNQDEGGNFLVGIHGRLFCVERDYQVGEHLPPYHSIGCGADYALGALSILHKQDIEAAEMVREALSVAQTWSAGVRAPFSIYVL